MTDAPRPAIWPSGSNARAFRFPMLRPSIANSDIVQSTCAGKASASGIRPVPFSTAINVEITTCAPITVVISDRMPTVITRRALMKLDTPATKAMAANHIGKVSAASNRASKIGWIEEMVANMHPTMKPCTTMDVTTRRLRRISAMPFVRVDTFNGRRLGAGSVSGCRMYSQHPAMIARMTKAMNRARQSNSAMMPLPIMGAMAGTIVKTIMMKLTTRAISRPTCRSRTMAIATTRGPAAPRPWITRPTSIHSRLSACQQISAPRQKTPMQPSITGLRPSASEMGPTISVPKPMPRTNIVTISWTWFGAPGVSSSVMTGKAGSMESMEKATVAIIAATRAMNSNGPVERTRLMSFPIA